MEKISTSTRTRRFQKTAFDAFHQFCQVWLGDQVIDAAARTLAGKKAAPLHQPQMFGGDIVRDSALLSNFPHGIAAAKQKLNDLNPYGVRQRFEAFRGLDKRIAGVTASRLPLCV
jgi:hypothetical protein